MGASNKQANTFCPSHLSVENFARVQTSNSVWSYAVNSHSETSTHTSSFAVAGAKVELSPIHLSFLLSPVMGVEIYKKVFDPDVKT